MFQHPLAGRTQGIALGGFQKQRCLHGGFKPRNPPPYRGRVQFQHPPCPRQACLTGNGQKNLDIIPMWFHAHLLHLCKAFLKYCLCSMDFCKPKLG